MIVIQQQTYHRMSAIREYIKLNKQFIKAKDHQSARISNSYTLACPYPYDSHRITEHITSRSMAMPQTLKKSKRTSLPPINQFSPKSQHYCFQLKRSQNLNKYFHSKNQSIVDKKQIKTEGSQVKTHRSKKHFTSILEQLRMCPLDKYFHRMENIRLAERLLVVKPSKELSRDRQKKFFKEQKYYKNKICRNSSVFRKTKSRKLHEPKEWIY